MQSVPEGDAQDFCMFQSIFGVSLRQTCKLLVTCFSNGESDMRWAASQLRRSGVSNSKDDSPTGILELA